MAMFSNEAPKAEKVERSIFPPRGRIGRVTYATRRAVALLACYFAGWLRAIAQGSGFQPLATCLICVVFAFMVVTSLKRLHDMGYSAWAVIILGGIFPLLALLPGEQGSNAYGNPPLKPFAGNANNIQRPPIAK